MSRKISIITPLFNEEESIDNFFTQIIPTMEKTEMDFEIICINDGSRDKTEEGLNAWAEKDTRVKIINFSRNFGQMAALTCGPVFRSWY